MGVAGAEWFREALTGLGEVHGFDGATRDFVEIVIGDFVVRVGDDMEPERLAAVILAFGGRDAGGVQVRGENAVDYKASS